MIDSTGQRGEFDTEQLTSYLRQTPNHKMLWSVKFRLGIYNMQGDDSTKLWNRLARNLGEAPVIYDSTLTSAGVDQLRRMLVNKGYLNSSVTTNTIADTAHRKIKVEYILSPGEEHRINSISYEFPDDTVRNLVMADSARFPVATGMPLDRDLLELQREFVTQQLRNRGYYAFAKELITFNADTTAGSLDVDLTMKVNPLAENQTGIRSMAYNSYIVRSVRFITDYSPLMGDNVAAIASADTVT